MRHHKITAWSKYWLLVAPITLLILAVAEGKIFKVPFIHVYIKESNKFWNISSVLENVPFYYLSDTVVPWDRGTVAQATSTTGHLFHSLHIETCWHFRYPVISDVRPLGLQIWQSTSLHLISAILGWKLKAKRDAQEHTKWYKVTALNQVADLACWKHVPNGELSDCRNLPNHLSNVHPKSLSGKPLPLCNL